MVVLNNTNELMALDAVHPASNLTHTLDEHEFHPVHRIQCGKSVLSLAVSRAYIYAGTQAGYIMV